MPYFLLELTQKHQLAPHTLTLEVTESAIMHNVQKSLAVVNCIHEIGFRLAIDDFGTGHSALSQLKRLPVDELKIDKSFVTRSDDAKDDAILRATIGLAHELGLTVVAEGVEDDATIARLTALGCEHAQGFGIGKPMPQEQFLTWLAQRRSGGHASVVALRGRQRARARRAARLSRDAESRSVGSPAPALTPARVVLAVQRELGVGVSLAVQQRLAHAGLDARDAHSSFVDAESVAANP